MPEKLTPRQVLQILRAGLAGDMWQLWSLTALMLTSWPMLRKCSHELRSAAAKVAYKAHPFSTGGEEPTETAKQKADLVNRAMASFKPDPATTDEEGFAGMVYDMADSFLLGASVCELVWHDVEGETLPRAAVWVHPRHLSFDRQSRLSLGPLGDNLLLQQSKYLVARYKSLSGSFLNCGMARPVAWWWSAIVFNREWMLNFAQKFGTPTIFATHKGLQQGELDQLEAKIAQTGNSRYLIAPEGTTANITPQGSMGEDNAHMAVQAKADEQVQMLFLGQTATTQGTEGKLGNEEGRTEVKQERVEDLAGVMAEALTTQFARAVLLVNYGDDSECPTVKADFTKPEKPMEVAQRVQTELATGLPFVAEEVYRTLNRTIPESGDLVVQNGKLGTMSDPAQQPVQPTPDEELAQQVEMAEAMGQFAQEPVEASNGKNGKHHKRFAI